MPTVLVTGASRGIGRAIAARLAEAGWDVLAAARRPADAESLVAEHPGRITPIALDITDEEQVAALGATLPPTLDAIVNNAGIAVGGPIEAVPAAELRRQLEVNVVGQAAVTQAVLPRLRSARGRIVFVSSVSGRIATPLTGAYNASKFALEGMADAMRLELAPWGIKVVVVEPAQTDTEMWQQADTQLETEVAAMSPEHRALYAKHIEGARKMIPRLQKMAVPPANVAAVVETALTARRPRARYVVGRTNQVQAAIAKVTPTPVLDAVLRLGAGVPRKP